MTQRDIRAVDLTADDSVSVARIDITESVHGYNTSRLHLNLSDPSRTNLSKLAAKLVEAA